MSHSLARSQQALKILLGSNPADTCVCRVVGFIPTLGATFRYPPQASTNWRGVLCMGASSNPIFSDFQAPHRSMFEFFGGTGKTRP